MAGADVPVPDVCIPDLPAVSGIPLPSLPIPSGRCQLVARCQPSMRRSERATGGAWGTGCVPCGVPSHPGTRRGTLQAGGPAALWGRRPARCHVEIRMGTHGDTGEARGQTDSGG